MDADSLDVIHCGNCSRLLESFPADSVDLIFADPPYNLQLRKVLYRPDSSEVSGVKDEWDKFASFSEYDSFTREWLIACRRIMKESATIWIIGSYHNIFRIGSILQDLEFWILNDIVWVKDNPMPNFRGVRFTNAHETLIWAQKKKGAKYTFNHQTMKALNDDLQMRSDWYFPLCTGSERIKINGSKAHATQKPEALLYRIILASSKPGDVILDPFFGTGTTGAIAKRLGRHFIGIENNPEYVKIAQERVAQEQTLPEGTFPLPERRSSTRIPFGALLEGGVLHPGEELVFSSDPNISAVIQVNGHLSYGELNGSIHAVARSLLQGKPVNGWDVWLYRENGKLILIDVLRQRIRISQSIREKNEIKENN